MTNTSVWFAWPLTAAVAACVPFGNVAQSEPAGSVQAAPRAALAATTAQPMTTAGVRMPAEWMPAHGRECARTGKYKNFCQGPRRVPKPFGEDAARAEKLGLGKLRTAGDLIAGVPKPEWVQAAQPNRNEKLLWPVDTGKLWRGLEAPRRTPTKFHPRHKGLDIGASEGTPIRAAMSGIVAYSDNEVHGYGNMLLVVHADGSVALYGHCKSIYVFAGQRVTQGQIVAEVGHTGIARGTHLHFEYRIKGFIKNPLRYLKDPVAPPPRRPNV